MNWFKKRKEKKEREYLDWLYQHTNIPSAQATEPVTPAKKIIHKELNLFFQRIKELETAMDKLLHDHPTANDFSDWFLYISNYAHPKSLWEDQYCRDYIRQRVQKGYKRYDDERLK